jgi:hypothetical protein
MPSEQMSSEVQMSSEIEQIAQSMLQVDRALTKAENLTINSIEAKGCRISNKRHTLY